MSSAMNMVIVLNACFLIMGINFHNCFVTGFVTKNLNNPTFDTSSSNNCNHQGSSTSSLSLPLLSSPLLVRTPLTTITTKSRRTRSLYYSSTVEPPDGITKNSSDDPLSILDLQPSLIRDKKAIRLAYKMAALKYHPDQVLNANSTPQEKKVANDKFAQVNWAYNTLINRIERNEQVKNDAVVSPGASYSDGTTEGFGSNSSRSSRRRRNRDTSWATNNNPSGSSNTDWWESTVRSSTYNNNGRTAAEKVRQQQQEKDRQKQEETWASLLRNRNEQQQQEQKRQGPTITTTSSSSSSDATSTRSSTSATTTNNTRNNNYNNDLREKSARYADKELQRTVRERTKKEEAKFRAKKNQQNSVRINQPEVETEEALKRASQAVAGIHNRYAASQKQQQQQQKQEKKKKGQQQTNEKLEEDEERRRSADYYQAVAKQKQQQERKSSGTTTTTTTTTTTKATITSKQEQKKPTTARTTSKEAMANSSSKIKNGATRTAKEDDAARLSKKLKAEEEARISAEREVEKLKLTAQLYSAKLKDLEQKQKQEQSSNNNNIESKIKQKIEGSTTPTTNKESIGINVTAAYVEELRNNVTVTNNELKKALKELEKANATATAVGDDLKKAIEKEKELATANATTVPTTTNKVSVQVQNESQQQQQRQQQLKEKEADARLQETKERAGKIVDGVTKGLTDAFEKVNTEKIANDVSKVATNAFEKVGAAAKTTMEQITAEQQQQQRDAAIAKARRETEERERLRILQQKQRQREDNVTSKAVVQNNGSSSNIHKGNANASNKKSNSKQPPLSLNDLLQQKAAKDANSILEISTNRANNNVLNAKDLIHQNRQIMNNHINHVKQMKLDEEKNNEKKKVSLIKNGDRNTDVDATIRISNSEHDSNKEATTSKIQTKRIDIPKMQQPKKKKKTLLHKKFGKVDSQVRDDNQRRLLSPSLWKLSSLTTMKEKIQDISQRIVTKIRTTIGTAVLLLTKYWNEYRQLLQKQIQQVRPSVIALFKRTNEKKKRVPASFMSSPLTMKPKQNETKETRTIQQLKQKNQLRPQLRLFLIALAIVFGRQLALKMTMI